MYVLDADMLVHTGLTAELNSYWFVFLEEIFNVTIYPRTIVYIWACTVFFTWIITASRIHLDYKHIQSSSPGAEAETELC